jgi:hypothetical protein
MTGKAHFQPVADWQAAAGLLAFVPRQPAYTGGAVLRSLQVFVRDHKQRELPVAERSLEAHYGAFVFSQSLHGETEAQRLALNERYGQFPREISVAGRSGRRYELGPAVPADDPDGRTAAVVVWHDAGRFYLVASTTLEADELAAIAASVHAP